MLSYPENRAATSRTVIDAEGAVGSGEMAPMKAFGMGEDSPTEGAGDKYGECAFGGE